ncbi:MAG TPA: phosphatidylserine decarboxylase family protein [Nitrospirales bacterium]|nr:phosphatidylserine decarboxylase family protein [Nitrospirales bacterium]
MRNFPIAPEALPFVLLLGALGTGAWFLDLQIASLILTLLAGWVVWFFRNPTRTIPDDPRSIVAPADGRVMEISEEEETTYCKERVTRVSIFLNIFDVHINRIPCSGEVRETGFTSGRYLAAMKPAASQVNHRHAILIRTPSGRQMLVVQIVGLIARRIRCWVKTGDQVTRGDRFGLIQFGSRVDTFLPLDVKLRVKVGDHVKGGSSILGEFS